MRHRQSAGWIATLLLASCGGSDPEPIAVGSIAFTNASAATVAAFLASPTSSASWGSPRNTAPIQPGATFTVGDLVPGRYDAMAVVEGSLSSYYAYAADFEVAAGQTYSLTAADSSFTGSLRIVNGSPSVALNTINLQPPGGAYGGNELATPLAPGASTTIEDLGAGSWGVRCVHANQATSTGTHAVNSLATTTVSCN